MSTIALADDHALVRGGLRRILEANGHVIVGETGDGLQVLPIVKDSRPEVLLLDLGMPGLHGLDALREVRRHVPSTKVLVVSAFSRDEFVGSAFRNGASGYLLKGSDPEELITAINDIVRGRYFLSGPLIGAISKPGGFAPASDVYDKLSSRERQVFHLMAEGLLNHQVGARLHVSTRTAETHRANIVRKLGFKTHTDVVLFALRRGILLLDESDGAPRNGH